MGEQVIPPDSTVLDPQSNLNKAFSPSSRKNSVHPAHNSELPISLQYQQVSGTGNPDQESWLPITASRDGNAFYSAFHTLNSGIGFQVLMLPVAFSILGWTWGVICLSVVFGWQFYTICLLIHLHEPVVSGVRYSRYMHLSKAAFGKKLGKLLAIFPVMYLSGGTCVMLIITSGETIKFLMRITVDPTTKLLPLTTVECYLVFICAAVALSLLLPNLNSIAWISFIGAITALLYCTLFWVASLSKTRVSNISYNPVKAKSDVGTAFSVFNAIGMIAFAFRGHNLILEIQATMPSNEKRPSSFPMSRGVNFAYLLIALCFFPIAIGGYWAYGNMIPNTGGMLKALYIFHRHDTSKFVLTLTTLMVVIHCLTSFQIYAMIIFDNLEFAYVTKKKKQCSKLIRSAFRIGFGCLTFFIAVAIPFLKGLAGMTGGLSLPLTLAYPCFMWIVIKKPKRFSVMWCINVILGSLGLLVSVLAFSGGIYSLVHPGIDVRFFKP